jgi:hypothetical protein
MKCLKILLLITIIFYTSSFDWEPILTGNSKETFYDCVFFLEDTLLVDFKKGVQFPYQLFGKSCMFFKDEVSCAFGLKGNVVNLSDLKIPLAGEDSESQGRHCKYGKKNSCTKKWKEKERHSCLWMLLL